MLTCYYCNGHADNAQFAHFYDKYGYIVSDPEEEDYWAHDWCAPHLSEKTMLEYRPEELDGLFEEEE